MIAVIKGDIIASRKIVQQDKWQVPLKLLLSKWGRSPRNWELVWGDFFQIEISSLESVIRFVFELKSLMKSLDIFPESKTMSPVDVRLAIGIGDKTFSAKRIAESNGSAFIHAGEKFDLLKREGVTMGIQSDWPDFDEEMNLYLKLVGLFMDKWSISSAQIATLAFKKPEATQSEMGKILGVKQSAVSRRWNRAHIDELLAVEKIYQKKIKILST